MAKYTGKVREKSGNFVSPEKWEPWFNHITRNKVGWSGAPVILAARD